eukprot:UN09329
MPVCQKQLINFQFNLPLNFVSDIQNGQKKTKKSRKKNVKTQLINLHNAYYKFVYSI